jgi:tRNA pseudouridine38-40 synthase
MHAEAHSRFDALSREYIYRIHQEKNPFLRDTSLYYPFKLNTDLLQEAAALILTQQDFSAFAKSNSQVKNFNCSIINSQWIEQGNELVYTIEANRFLRGMVRLITATLLKTGRGKLSLKEVEQLFVQGGKTVFSVPAHGLYLKAVKYPANYFSA